MRYMIIVMDMMKRKTFVLQIFLVLFCVSFAHALVDVIHDAHSTTWSQASEKCGKDGLKFRESVLKESEVLQRKVFWLGNAIYNKTSDWIEILGFYNIRNAPGIRRFSEISCIAECQIKCSSLSFTHFGYKEATRMCICSKKTSLVKTNIRTCENKTSSYSYFFFQVYQELVSRGDGGLCTLLQCIEGNNNLKAVDCTHRDSHILARCRNLETNYVVWGKTYQDSLYVCMSKHSLLLAPSYYCTLAENRHKGLLSWTNVFRDVCEYQLTKAEGGIDQPLQCLAGQLVQINSQWKLLKTKKECNDTLHRYACRNDLVSTTSYSKYKSSPTFKFSETKPIFMTNLVSLLSSVKKDITTSGIPFERIAYKNRDQTNNQTDLCTNGNKSNVIVAIIGGMIGALSMIAASIVLIVCKIRSKRFFKESSNYEDTRQVNFANTIYEDLNNTRSKKSTTVSTQTSEHDESRSPVYEDINESEKQKNIKPT